MLIRARVYGVAALLLLAMWVAARDGQSQPAAPGFKGEYFATKNADPVCLPFARNLNDFRRLDFDVCDPRLSDKYPQFTRPVWEEMPFDLALAETIFKNPPTSPPSPYAERWWQKWLKESEARRSEGKLKLWRARVDIDGDGSPETLVRLDYLLPAETTEKDEASKLKQNPCPYRDGKVYMLESANPALKKAFNLSGSGLADVIYFADGRAHPTESNGF